MPSTAFQQKQRIFPVATEIAFMKIGELQLIRESRQILRNGSPVKISSRAFDLFRLLLDADGALVTTEEILTKVWPSTFVEENNIQVHISTLRRLLGDDRKLIQTVTGRGYRMAFAEAASMDKMARPRSPSPSRPDFSLPPRHGPLFGREPCLGRVKQALGEPCAVISLTGAAGVGKSLLAIEAGNRIAAQGEATVRYLSLAEQSDRPEAIEAIGAALEALKADPPTAHGGVGALPAILIIDNCDRHHNEVIEALRDSAAHRQSTRTTIMVTSRTPLHAASENVLHVPSLLSLSGEKNNAAVEMLIVRMRTINPAIELSANFLRHAHDLVAEMDGLPLAIELAAQQASLLGIETVCHLIRENVALPTQDLRRMVEPRHASLDAALRWTWAELEPLPRALLADLSHVAREFDALELGDMARRKEICSADILDAISTLVESWFIFREYRGSTVVYRMANTVRRFLRQQSKAEPRSAPPFHPGLAFAARDFK